MIARSVTSVTLAALVPLTLSCGRGELEPPMAPARACARSTIFFGRGDIPAGTTLNQAVSVPAEGRISVEVQAPSARELVARIAEWPCFEGPGATSRCEPLVEKRAQAATVSLVSPLVVAGRYIVSVTHNGPSAESVIEVFWLTGVCG